MDISTVIENIGAYTNEAILIADADVSDGAVMALRWINPAFTALLGYERKDILGQTARILVGPGTDPATHAAIIEKLEAWQSFTNDAVIQRKDGSQFWAQLSFQPVRNDKGRVKYWICLLIDVSARKQIQDKLADLSRIAQNTRDMAIVLDEEREVLWTNASFTSFTGYTPAEAKGHRLSDLLRAEQTDDDQAAEMIAALDRHETAHAEMILRRRDNSLFIAQVEYQPIFEDGKLVRYVSLIRDTTERRMLEMRYKGVFDETNAAISIKSGDRFLMVNRRFAQDHGKVVSEIEGKTAEEVFPDLHRMDLESVERHVAETSESMEWERTVLGRDGQFRHELTKTFPVFDPLLDTNLICSVSTDVTAIRQAETALRQSQKAALAAERRLWGALDAMSDGFVLYDAQDRLVMFNKAFKTMHGHLGDRLEVGMTYREFVEAGVEVGQWDLAGEPAEDWLADHFAARSTEMRLGLFVPLANERWLLCKEVELQNGERAGIRIDVSDVKRNEAELRRARAVAERAERRMMAAVEAVGDGFSMYDADDRLVVYSYAGADSDVYGMPEFEPGQTFEHVLRTVLSKKVVSDAIGREEEWLAERIAHHRNPHGTLDQCLSDGRIFRIYERRTEDGDTVSLRLNVTREREQEARLSDYARDLEASKALVEQRNSALEVAKANLEHASLHDALTGLANRRYLDQELQRRKVEVDPDTVRPGQGTERLSVLHIDLDRFKQINDAFGHAAGDFVLRHVASVLRTETRSGDFAARVGGDEFVILCHGGRDKKQLGEFASRIIKALSKPVSYEGQECRFGASIGIAVAQPGASGEEGEGASENISSAEQLLIDADIALYRAKSAGRNRWAFFTDALQAEVLAAKLLSDQILRAIDNREFHVLYQPQVNAHTGAVTGVEALLRWSHPTRGTLLPTDFISAAEDLNVMPQIDAIVLEHVMRDDARWRELGLTVPRIAVNVSGRRLRDPELIRDIKEGGLDPSRLSLEILESVFVDEEDEVLAWNIDQLREMGVEIELDDFGTGHSSIVGLINLKPKRLKIDRTFVEQTLTPDADAAVIRAMVQIGRSLDVEIVAEGIETIAQGERLTALGCDVLQGFAYAVPMRADELRRYLYQKAKGASETAPGSSRAS